MHTKALLVFIYHVVTVVAVPFPPSITSSVPEATGSPFFGSGKGNFQPNRTTNSGDRQPDVIGGQVSSTNVAMTSNFNHDGVGDGSDVYIQYNGSGNTSEGWPQKYEWASFANMFKNNKKIMFLSCRQYNVANNHGHEVGTIYDAIQAIALETRLDHRFILAVMMQESGGCVRVPTTNYGVRNSGMMQDHNGDATCNNSDGSSQGDAEPYSVLTPCPTGTIVQMLREGSAGTASGDGLAQCINRSGADDVSAFYKAARIYNSGSIHSSGDLGKGHATRCYASDIANRLTGWVQAEHECTLDD